MFDPFDPTGHFARLRVDLLEDSSGKFHFRLFQVGTPRRAFGAVCGATDLSSRPAPFGIFANPDKAAVHMPGSPKVCEKCADALEF